MSKSAAAPDYTKAAEAQGASSAQVTNMQTWANRPNINTPFGSQSWQSSAQIDPATGQKVTSWTQNNTLTPAAQQALTAQQNIQAGKSSLAQSQLGNMQQQFSGQPDWNNFQQLKGSPDVPTYQGPAQNAQYNNLTPGSQQTSLNTSGNVNVDPSQRYYNNAGDAVWNQFQQRQEPIMAQQTDQLRTQLYNQGLREGDAAYDRAMKTQSQQQNDARQTAMNQATTMAGSEAQRMQGMDLSTNQNQFQQELAQGNYGNQANLNQFGMNAQATGVNNANATNTYNQNMAAANMNNANQSMAFGQGQSAATMNNTLRQQQIAEMMQKRGFSLNEMNAILNGQQVSMPTMPSFNQATKSDAIQYSQAAQQQYSAAQDAANAQNALTGQVIGAVGAAAGSDRRLKRHVKLIGKYHGHNLYVYQYIWGGNMQVGVMADEVAHIPGVVFRHASGYDMVNYDRL